MSFWRLLQRLNMSGGPSEIQKASSGSLKAAEYAKLTKEELISKVLELEKRSDKKERLQEKMKKQKPFDFQKHNTRFIGLKFSYLGWNYNGLAIQKEPTPLPTVEGVIIEALHKCRLIPSLNPGDSQFSRCGRTDKGVSALNQVISLKVRSNLTKEEQNIPENDEKEIDYINILNNLLPSDIRFHAISLRPPPGFDARFSCESRHYKYLFHRKGLDIEVMQQGAKLYEGIHDFRNFCKLDGSKQITNYERTIIKSQVIPIDDEFYCFDLEGSAFLWHQVRNMVAVLFLVGQKLETPEIISNLLDVKRYPTRPIFDMGSDFPLILYDCKFPDTVEWTYPRKCVKSERTVVKVYSQYIENQMKAQVSRFMFDKFAAQQDIYDESFEQGRTRINLGDGVGKIVGDYVPLSKRERLETYQAVNERWANNKKRKLNE